MEIVKSILDSCSSCKPDCKSNRKENFSEMEVLSFNNNKVLNNNYFIKNDFNDPYGDVRKSDINFLKHTSNNIINEKDIKTWSMEEISSRKRSNNTDSSSNTISNDKKHNIINKDYDCSVKMIGENVVINYNNYNFNHYRSDNIYNNNINSDINDKLRKGSKNNILSQDLYYINSQNCCKSNTKNSSNTSNKINYNPDLNTYLELINLDCNLYDSNKKIKNSRDFNENDNNSDFSCKSSFKNTKNNFSKYKSSNSNSNNNYFNKNKRHFRHNSMYDYVKHEEAKNNNIVYNKKFKTNTYTKNDNSIKLIPSSSKNHSVSTKIILLFKDISGNLFNTNIFDQHTSKLNNFIRLQDNELSLVLENSNNSKSADNQTVSLIRKINRNTINFGISDNYSNANDSTNKLRIDYYLNTNNKKFIGEANLFSIDYSNIGYNIYLNNNTSNSTCKMNSNSNIKCNSFLKYKISKQHEFDLDKIIFIQIGCFIIKIEAIISNNNRNKRNLTNSAKSSLSKYSNNKSKSKNKSNNPNLQIYNDNKSSEITLKFQVDNIAQSSHSHVNNNTNSNSSINSKNGNNSTYTFQNNTKITLGRSSKNDIKLDSEEISKTHCTITLSNNKLCINDGDLIKNSFNGTWLIILQSLFISEKISYFKYDKNDFSIEFYNKEK